MPTTKRGKKTRAAKRRPVRSTARPVKARKKTAPRRTASAAGTSCRLFAAASAWASSNIRLLFM